MNLDSENDSPEFTVIIGTFNGERKISGALTALSRQITTHKFEVIVVDDASTDATRVAAGNFDVTMITQSQNRGHGAALNAGLSKARGKFIALMDDDCVPPPDWIEKLADAWSTAPTSTSAIGGVVEPLETNTWNRRYVKVRRPLVHQEELLNESAGFFERLKYVFFPPSWESTRRSVYFTVGANMSLLTSRAREVGGFTAEKGAGEEESISRPLRAIYGPRTIELVPSIIMYHDFAPSVADSFRRARSYGRTSGRNWIRDRDIPSLPPRPLIAAVIGVILGWSKGSWAFIALLALPPVLYRNWVHELRHQFRTETISYPYLQFVEEIFGIVGFIQGALQIPMRSVGTDRIGI